MKTVFLAGGQGTRIREESTFRPKPMIDIGNMPLLWHLMKFYSYQGFSDFVICAGYKHSIIKEFFSHFYNFQENLEIDLANRASVVYEEHNLPKWKIYIANTGEHTNTGGRLKKIEKHVSQERFLCTYGDGLSDINLNRLLEFHIAHGKLATLTSVHPKGRFGHLNIDKKGKVLSFEEKPSALEWINGGFFIFEPEVLEMISENSVLEVDLLPKLSELNELFAYQHAGFWQPMDTYREYRILNELWESGEAPWRIWND